MVRKSDRGTLELEVNIDQNSGFCYGVIRAIEEAERFLARSKPLYSLGAMVHNNEELERLRKNGLRIVNPDQLSTIQGETIIIRAHGEPPSTYVKAQKYGIKIVDCTCPVVLKLQQKIGEEYRRIKPLNGQIVLFGKSGHAEVNGLIGQVSGDAVIIEPDMHLDRLDFNRPISLFAQTTQDPSTFLQLCQTIEVRYRAQGVNPTDHFTTFHTICQQVAGRLPLLREFAKQHQVVLFVSGKESSNGRVLFEACKSANNRSYRIENTTSLCKEWFCRGDSVGVCGATSTPKWLMEEVAKVIQTL